jgi:hypothetical protein
MVYPMDQTSSDIIWTTLWISISTRVVPTYVVRLSWICPVPLRENARRNSGLEAALIASTSDR